MPTFFTTPAFARQGVVTGFVLAAPIFRGLGQAPGASAFFHLYNADVTLYNPTRSYKIATGFCHWVTINSRAYNYYQQDNDTVLIIATALAAAINDAGDPGATATAGANGITLSPRGNTGASIPIAADGMWYATLTELTGNRAPPLHHSRRPLRPGDYVSSRRFSDPFRRPRPPAVLAFLQHNQRLVLEKFPHPQRLRRRLRRMGR